VPGLSRRAGSFRPAAPVKIVHLGLGNFFRAHPAWYTEHASDAPEWGIAAFGGRGREPAQAIAAQDGLYTLVIRAAEADRFEVVASISRAHEGRAHQEWLACVAAPETALVTVTVTEAGYRANGQGRLDTDDPAVQADVAALCQDLSSPVTTAPARLVAGLAARHGLDAGPLAVVPCDNVPGNAAVTGQVLGELAAMVDPALETWIDENVSVVGTVVDRITPRATESDRRTVALATGFDDEVPVVTEAYHEWVISGSFPLGRPGWESAAAVSTDDLEPYEHRKLWLLNGAHSLLAYAGSIIGHTTVAQAMSDERCREWLGQWWDEAGVHLPQPAGELAAYRSALAGRFGNPRIGDRLARIAEDGSEKLRVRVVPVVRAEREAGRVPHGAARILSAWVCHLRGLGAPVRDVRAERLAVVGRLSWRPAVRAALDVLDPTLAGDDVLAAVVLEGCRELAGSGA
jgi:fructuronate reductase